MNNYNTAICIVGICLVITALVIFINHLRTKKTIDTIENMLNEAAKGNFSEKSFDETRLSSLETRFAHYLSASVVSARNVELEKDKIKSLIADISHQTKTPIANLLLYSELLLEDDTDNLSVQMRENIVQIHAQSEKLQFLIASLVKLSRLENGILQLSPQEEALKSMLTLAVKETEFKARAKGLELILHDTDEKAYFDSKWTLEAICNILDPEVLALGGGLSAAGPFLFDPLQDKVSKKCFYSTRGKLVPAVLGNEAGMIGAALLARDAEA